jgi:hypothetical protein
MAPASQALLAFIHVIRRREGRPDGAYNCRRGGGATLHLPAGVWAGDGDWLARAWVCGGRVTPTMAGARGAGRPSICQRAYGRSRHRPAMAPASQALLAFIHAIRRREGRPGGAYNCRRGGGATLHLPARVWAGDGDWLARAWVCGGRVAPTMAGAARVAGGSPRRQVNLAGIRGGTISSPIHGAPFGSPANYRRAGIAGRASPGGRREGRPGAG